MTETKQPPTAEWRRDANKAREAFMRLVDNAFRDSGARAFASIPADPDRDADLILGRIVEAFPRLLDALEGAQRGIDYLCDRYGLPHDVDALIRHLEGNEGFVRATDAKTIAIQKHKLERAQAVVPWMRSIKAMIEARGNAAADSHALKNQPTAVIAECYAAACQALAAYDAHDAPAEEARP